MALRIITHCYSYLRNITHIEEVMSNSSYYSIWLILRTKYISSQAPQQAHRTVDQQQSTRAPAVVLLSIRTIPISEHLGGEDSGAATQNAIYRISLLIITHHYTIHYAIFITHHYSSLLK